MSSSCVGKATGPAGLARCPTVPPQLAWQLQVESPNLWPLFRARPTDRLVNFATPPHTRSYGRTAFSPPASILQSVWNTQRSPSQNQKKNKLSQRGCVGVFCADAMYFIQSWAGGAIWGQNVLCFGSRWPYLFINIYVPERWGNLIHSILVDFGGNLSAEIQVDFAYCEVLYSILYCKWRCLTLKNQPFKAIKALASLIVL